MRVLRTDSVKVWLTPAEKRALRRLAGARHLSVYLRHLALGSRATAAEDADDWWAALPAGRREQIHHWITGGRDVGPSREGWDPIPELVDLLG